jgi:hypothetical protein
MNVEFDMGTKHEVKGYGRVSFYMDSRGILRVMNVIWVPKHRRSVLLVSRIEKKVFDVLFKDG